MKDNYFTGKDMTIGSTVWGPYAWHLLHAISIGDNTEIYEEDRHWYYLFYTSFEFLLPCPVCAQHYNQILTFELPIYEEFICRDYMKKWVYQLHNIINENLEKKIEGGPIYPYKKCIEENQSMRMKENHYFLSKVYLHADYEQMSIFTFDRMITFLKSYCILCPHPQIRQQIQQENIVTQLDEIMSPLEFKKWFAEKSTFFLNDSSM
jgi:hypothetical protein